MKTAFVLLSLLLMSLAIRPVSAAPDNDGKHVADELLVQLRSGVRGEELARLLSRNALKLDKTVPRINVLVLKVPAERLETVQKALSHNPLFELVEKNYLASGSFTPNDPKYASQWHLPKIMASQGWDISTGDSRLTIAVIDSGADSNHPDLAGKLLPGHSFLLNSSDTSDVLGHGTAVAGTAAAMTDNAAGVAGVAWNHPVMPLVVLDSSNYASYSNIASAIVYAADRGVRVMSISIGGSSPSSTMQSAVNYAWNRGAIVVACAMNNSSTTPMYPAALDRVIAVSATDKNDNKSSFSNYGEWIDVSAPGSSILTTTRGGGYGTWSGTSFSTPIVAGVAALILSVDPLLTNAQVEEILKQNSDDLGEAGFDPYFGYGRVNVYKALLAASQAAPVVDTLAPSATITSPQDGTTVSGTVTVNVDASDNTGVSKVDLYLNGTYFSTDTTAPFSFLWDSTKSSNGTHRLTARAQDPAGNTGVSVDVLVPVSNTADNTPPSVTITSPSAGSTVSATVKVSVSALDESGVSKVELYVDGSLLAADSSAPYVFNWNTKKVKSGTHTLEAQAYDTAGNAANSASVSVYKK